MGPIRDTTQAMGQVPTDFCQLFNNDVDRLYTLSLLLTADRQKAEQCFVSGLEDCLNGNSVFREWAQAWAKRCVIRNAIRLIAPMATEMSCRQSGILMDEVSRANRTAAITSLPPFHRFVYVLSVLEKYSDPECAILLNSTAEEIQNTRTQAVRQLATGQQGDELAAAG